MSKVLEVPANWVVCELDDVLLKMTNGANVTQFEERVGYPICRIETIWNEGIDLDRVKYIKENAPEFIEKYALQYGDILLSHINSDAHLGKTGLFKSQVETLIHGINILLLRPAENISPEFLNYQLKHLRAKGAFIDAAQRAVNQSSINQKRLKSFRVFIAPLPEQHRIVAKIEEMFSELDKGIENLKTAQAQLKVYRQALLKYAFEGKLTAQWRADNPDKLEPADALLKRIQQERTQRYQQQLAEWEAGGKQGSKPKAPKPLLPISAEELAELPELPEGWVWTRLGNTNVDVSDGPFGSNLKSSDYVDAGVRVIRLENVGALEFIEDKESFITEAKYELLKNHTVKSGDIIFSSFITENVRVALLPASIQRAVNKADCFCVRLYGEALSNAFAVMFLSTRHVFKQLEAQIHGVGRPRINTTQLKEVAIPVCGIQEQQAIISLVEARLSEADQLDQILTTSLQQAEALRQSILKKAFSGQLVPQDPHDEPASALLARIRADRDNASQKSALAGRRKRGANA